MTNDLGYKMPFVAVYTELLTPASDDLYWNSYSYTQGPQSQVLSEITVLEGGFAATITIPDAPHCQNLETRLGTMDVIVSQSDSAFITYDYTTGSFTPRTTIPSVYGAIFNSQTVDPYTLNVINSATYQNYTYQTVHVKPAVTYEKSQSPPVCAETIFPAKTSRAAGTTT